MEKEVRVSDKILLSVEEASAYTGIGRDKLYALISEPGCTYVLHVGRKVLIKRKRFEMFLEQKEEL